MRRLTVGVLLGVLLLAGPVAAQETRGAIEGIVKDTSGAVLPGATIEATSEAGTFTAVTDAAGIYRFPALNPGRYEISAALQGFVTARSAPVFVEVGKLLKVDLALQVAGVAESVQVTAESPTIDVKQSTAATNLRADAIERMPKGRDFTSLVTLAPGANSESRSGGLSIDGASAAENKYYLDGIDTTNLRTGISATPFLTDFIEEVQVKSSGYPAEFGGSTGGVVSIISKSGTNQFRGEAGAYFNNDSLNGDLALNNAFGTAGTAAAGSGVAQAATGTTGTRRALRLLLSGANAAETVEYPKDDYSRWDPHFQVGGPIVHDRLWFWGGYTPQVEDTDRTITFRTNGQTATFNSKERTQNMVGNMTWQMSDGVRFRVSGQNRPFDQDGRLPNVDGTSNPLTNFADLGVEQDNITTTGNLDWVTSPRVFLNAKVNYLKYDTRDIGIPDETWHQFVDGSNAVFETRPELVRAAGFNSVLTNRARTRDIYSRIGASADATFYVTAGGQHTFKTGLQFERIGNDVADIEQQPHVSFHWDTPHTLLDGSIQRGTFGYWSWRQFGTLGEVNVNNLGLFFQDAWTVNDKLTLNLGIRTEREDIPSYRENLSGIKFSFADKLAPRAGFAYDMRGDGKWKVYGSWGVFYDTMKLELPRGAFGGDVWIERYYTLDTLDWNTILADGPDGFTPGRFLEAVDFRIPSNDPACPECGAIDPDLKPFRQQEFVAGIDHEISPRMAVSARYVHKQVDRAIEDVGVIVPGIGEVFFISNPGEGTATTINAADCPTCPGLPEIKRNYDALELKANKRFADNWQFTASYTLSRLFGNYPGLASSDEIARVSPNVTRLFDGLVMAFDQNGEPVYGRLNTDRPHQFKFLGIYQLPTRTILSGVFRAASGIPITRQANFISSLPVFFLGRGSDGRTPWLTVFDLSLQQDIPLAGRVHGQFSLNVLNLFDQKGVTDVFRAATRIQNIPIELEDFFAGFDTEALINTLNITRDPRFLQDQYWQAPREIRFGFKVIF
jgi:hypothetical protein